MSCKVVTTKGKIRQFLIQKRIIDTKNNIIDEASFSRYSKLWQDEILERYDLDLPLVINQNNMVLFNTESLKMVDALKGIVYPENESLSVLGNNEKNESEKLKETLLEFVKKINPDFRVEYVENLSSNGILKLNEFLLQYKIISALPEEVAHIFVEMIDKESSLFKEMDEAIVDTKMYKKVYEEYKNHPEYKGNFAKIRREAIAKLISLYTYDETLAERYIGSKDILSKVKSLIMRFLNKFKSHKNPFKQSAINILSLKTDNLLYENALTSTTMYQLSEYDRNDFQTLSKNPTDYDVVLLNINDTLFDYKNYTIPDRPGKKDPSKTVKGKTIKSKMFFHPELKNDRIEYYKNVRLTKLGRELRDKIRIVDPTNQRFILYTDMEISPELLDRVRSEFGHIPVVQTSGEKITGEDENGNPVTQKIEKSEVLNGFLSGKKGLLIDSERNDIINNPSNYTNLDFHLYNNDRAKYRDFREIENQMRLEKEEKEFTEGVIQEFQKIDKSTIVGLVKPALNLIRSIVNKIENNEDVSKVFEDEYGNLILPQQRAKLILQQLEENPEEFSQGLINFINTISSSVLFWKNANKTDYQYLRNLSNGTKEDVNKAIKDSAALMRMILQWESWLESIRPILSDPSFEETSLIKAVMGDLSNTLKISKDRINNIAVDVLSKQLADLGKNYNEGKLLALKSGQITQEQYDSSIITPQKIANIIFGLEGDTALTSYFENPLFVNNDLIQTVSAMVEKSIIGANRESLEKSALLGKKLWELEESMGRSSTEVGEEITYIDRENYWSKEEGEEKATMKQRDVLMLLNPFKNRWMRKQKLNEVEIAKEDFYNLVALGSDDPEHLQQVEIAKKTYHQKLEEFKRWEKDNWNREIHTEPMEIYEAFGLRGIDGDALDRAIEIQQRLYDEKRALMSELKTQKDPSSQTILQKEIELLEKRIKNLRNPFDNVSGKVKEINDDPEKDIRVAKILKEKHIIDRQIYEYQTNQERFVRDLKNKIAEISDAGVKDTLMSLVDSSEGDWKSFLVYASSIAPQSLIDWLELNTKFSYSEDFYETRKQVINRLQDTIAELSTFGSYKNDDLIQTLSKELNDSWEEIFNLSSSLRDEDGIFDASDSSLELQKIIKSAESKISQLKQQLKEERSFSNLSDEEMLQVISLKSQIKLLIEELSSLQLKEPTEYYHQTMYEKLVNIWPRERGLVFDGENFLSFIDRPEFSQWLNTEAPQEFKEWFNANHFLIEGDEGEVNEFGEMVKPVYYKPTYIWMKIRPVNDDHILLRPGYKYSEREMKDEVFIEYGDQTKYFRLKTEKNAETWDAVMKEWLPKRKGEFINEEYEKLKNDLSKAKQFEYLQTITDFHLNNQVEAPRDTKLGYRVPFMEKTFTDGGGIGSLWKEFGNRLNPVEKGEANPESAQNIPSTFKDKVVNRLRAFIGLESKETKVIATDLLGNPIQSVYTPYTGWKSPDLVTRNIAVASLHYAESLNRTKALVNNIPELNLLEQLLEQFNPFEQNTVNRKGNLVKSKSNRTLDIIRNIKQTQIFGNVKDYELGESIDRWTIYLRHYTSFFSQSVLNPANAVKNFLQGQFVNIISSGAGDWSDTKSIVKAAKSTKTSYANFLLELRNKEKSKDFQIISLFNLSLSNNISDLYSSTGGKRLVGDPKKFGFLSSEASEFAVITTLLYAHLDYKKITIDGKEHSLYDVFELKNGVLSIRENAYDGETKIDQDYVDNLILRAKTLTEHIQGKQWAHKVADRYTLWRNMEFFKKYFIPKLRERFSTQRRNIVIGEDIEGFYVTIFKRFAMEVLSYLEQGKFSQVAMSPMEKRAMHLIGKELLVMLSTYLIITYLFGFDDDDDDKYKKLKEKTWAENFALLTILNAKKETDSTSIIPLLNVQENLTPPLFNETYQYVKEPFIGFGLFEQATKLTNAAMNSLTGSDPYYEINQPHNFIEKGDSKFTHRLEKLLGYDDILYLSNPHFKVQVQQQANNL